MEIGKVGRLGRIAPLLFVEVVIHIDIGRYANSFVNSKVLPNTKN